MMFDSRTRTLFQRLGIVWAVCSIVAIAPAVGQIPCRYEVAAIIKAPDGPISDSPTYAMAISPNGEWVVGYYVYDGVAEPRGWYWHMPNGPLTTLPHPPGMFTSSANDVNDSGKVCGYIAGSGGDFGFVFDINTQQYTLLPPANVGGTCNATSINSSGVVCGVRSITGGSEPTDWMNAFVWSLSGGFQDTGLIDGLNCGFIAISDNGTVAGWRGSHSAAANTRAIAGSLSSLQILPPVTGGTSSTAHSVNAAGDVCGYGRTPSPFGGFDNRAFVWRDGMMTMLGVLPGYRRSYANEITDAGVVGGQCTTLESNGAFAPSAFVWHRGVMHDVNAMLINQSGEIIEMDSVGGIDRFGRLAGSGFANGEHGTAIVLSPADLLGDLTKDCQVDINDLLAVLNAWGTSDPDGDADGDGFVNINDLLTVLNNWMN